MNLPAWHCCSVFIIFLSQDMFGSAAFVPSLQAPGLWHTGDPWVTSAAEKKESSEAELSSSSVRSRKDPSANGSIKVFSGGEKETTCVGVHGPTSLLAPVLSSTPTLSLLLHLAYRKDIKPGRKLALYCSQVPYPDPAARCPMGERSQTPPGGGRLGARGTPASQQTPFSGTPPGKHRNVTLS